MDSDQRTDERPVYEIEVQGTLEGDWSAWFGGLSSTVENDGHSLPVTVISAEIADQSALRGILSRLWDLNLVVVSVRRIEPHRGKEV